MTRVFVHRRRWSHTALRKKMRRMLREGKARILSESADGWLYEVLA